MFALLHRQNSLWVVLVLFLFDNLCQTVVTNQMFCCVPGEPTDDAKILSSSAFSKAVLFSP